MIRSNSNGFTLVEVLVTITIIGILAGLVYAGVARTMDQANRTWARNDLHQLKSSFSSYFTDYRRLPVNQGDSGATYLDIVTEESIMDGLMGADSEIGRKLNPKGTNYLSGKGAKRIGADRFARGLATHRDGGGTLWDPWGRLYGLRIDLSDRKRTPNPEVRPPQDLGGKWGPRWGSRAFTIPTPYPVISESVLVWSSGRNEESASDNIISW